MKRTFLRTHVSGPSYACTWRTNSNSQQPNRSRKAFELTNLLEIQTSVPIIGAGEFDDTELINVRTDRNACVET